jgi:hypothetical protein
MKRNITLAIISLISALLCGFFTYQILMNVNPPITPDGHRYMPTNNLFQSTLVSIVLLPVIFLSIKKAIKFRNR